MDSVQTQFFFPHNKITYMPCHYYKLVNTKQPQRSNYNKLNIDSVTARVGFHWQDKTPTAYLRYGL